MKTRMDQKLRRQQMLAAGVDIARESGFVGLDCYTLADRLGCHHNLVRLYIGRRLLLCEQVAYHAFQLDLAPVVKEARKLGFLK